MVKIYYEEAKRVQGKPDDVAGNGRGTADIHGPQVDAQVDADVEDAQEESPRKRCETAQDVVRLKGNMEETKFGVRFKGLLFLKRIPRRGNKDCV